MPLLTHYLTHCHQISLTCTAARAPLPPVPPPATAARAHSRLPPPCSRLGRHHCRWHLLRPAMPPPTTANSASFSRSPLATADTWLGYPLEAVTCLRPLVPPAVWHHFSCLLWPPLHRPRATTARASSGHCSGALRPSSRQVCYYIYTTGNRQMFLNQKPRNICLWPRNICLWPRNLCSSGN
jgi:hypothetical protein